MIPSFPTVPEPKRYKQTRLLVCSSSPVPTGIHTPLSPSSSNLVDDDGTYGKLFMFSYSCSRVLIVVVVVLRFATVFYHGVSKPIVNFSRWRCNSPKQVHPAALSFLGLVAIVDDSMYGRLSWLSFSFSTTLIIVVTALRLAASSEDSDYATRCSCSCRRSDPPKHRRCRCVGGIG